MPESTARSIAERSPRLATERLGESDADLDEFPLQDAEDGKHYVSGGPRQPI